MKNLFLKAIVFLFSILLFGHGIKASSFMESGSESKLGAGAGTTISRGPAAIYYNPANLILSKDIEPYVELYFLDLKYSYEYPGYDPIVVKVSTPVPFIGLTYKPSPDLALSVTYLPSPNSGGATTLDNVPTREVSETPILVNVQSKGRGNQYTFGFGAAYKLFDNFIVGASYIRNSSGSEITAYDCVSGVKLYESDSVSTTDSFRIGTRLYFFDKKFILGLTYKPIAETISKGTDWSVSPYETAPLNGSATTKEYSYVSVGIEGRMWAFAPFAEITRENHRDENIGNQNKEDLYDVYDFVFGSKLRLAKGHNLIGAYGYYPSYMGDGLMKERSVNNTEISGITFGNIDALPRTVYSGGYQYISAGADFDAGISYKSGNLSVSEQGRGYGNYSLQVFMVTFGGTYRF